MAIESAADRAAFFAEDGQAATYTPPAGPALACTVLLDAPSDDAALFGPGRRTRAWTARVRADEIAAPAAGATLAVGALSFTVKASRVDLSGALHILDLAAA